MFKIAFAIAGTTTIILSVVVYRLKNFYDAAILYAAHLVNKNNAMTRIISAHGCAPKELVAPGTIYDCPDCEVSWEAGEMEIEWLDDRLSNRTIQRWDVILMPTPRINFAGMPKNSDLPDT
jgi:hypothetical protein